MLDLINILDDIKAQAKVVIMFQANKREWQMHLTGGASPALSYAAYNIPHTNRYPTLDFLEINAMLEPD